MATLSFYNSVSSYPQSTTESLKTIREHNPDALVWISIDGRDHPNQPYFELTNSKTYVVAHEEKMGYCPYTCWQMTDWLGRIFTAVTTMKTSHFCMWEDDTLCTKPVTVEDDWECAGHVIRVGNKIPQIILDEIERFSGVKPTTDYYGAGGGSIFKTKTFVDNYWKISNYITSNTWDIYRKNYYPEAGYIDCFMVLYYLLCGKSYTPNPNILNLWPTDYITSWGELKEKYGEYQLIHNTKRYY